MSFTSLVGNIIVNNKGEEIQTSTLSSKQGSVIGLLFSARWCPPGRLFIPQLAEIYNEIKDAKKDFEVIFISSDNCEKAFKEHHESMPWLAIPYNNSDEIENCLGNYSIEGFPTLVLLDGETGEIITKEGRRVVLELGAEGFPFSEEKEQSDALKAKKEAALEKCKSGQKNFQFFSTEDDSLIIDKNGKAAPLTKLQSAHVVGLYFGARWHWPCRGFTPKLIEFYNECKSKNKKFEIVYVSSDRNEDDFKEYFGEMPWYALSFNEAEDKGLVKQLDQLYDVEAIPTLVLLTGNGNLITNQAISAIYRGVDAFPYLL